MAFIDGMKIEYTENQYKQHTSFFTANSKGY